MVESVVLQEREGEVAFLTLNRPEKRNALNLEIIKALHGVLDGLREDREVRVVVLSGAGEHFAGGADIAELKERGREEALESLNGSLFNKLEELPVPVIAAVRGFALGGGCELASACDLRIAGESARMGQPEVGLGIIPGAGATHRLPRLVGMGRAKELILTGRIVDAAEALQMGLVNKVVPDAEVLEEVKRMAAVICRQDATAVRLAKLALNTQRHGLEAARVLESVAQAVTFESPEKDRRMGDFLNRKR